MMYAKFPIKDEVLHSNLDSIPKSSYNTDTGTPKDILSIFIDGQSKALITDDYLEKISSPFGKGEFNRLVKMLEEINKIMEEINIIIKLETPHVELKIYPSRYDQPL